MIQLTLDRRRPMGKALFNSGIMVITGLIIMLIAWQLKHSLAAQELAYQRQMDQLRDQVAHIRRDREWTLAYQPGYTRMVNQGLIGEERRLEWRAVIIELAERLKLPELKMTFSPKTEFNPPTDNADQAAADSQVTGYQSEMALELSLFHGADLLSLLDTLDRSRSAILMPLRCRMALQEEPLYLDASARIDSHCDLQWITVKPSPPLDNYGFY
ncbi:MAG: hypothetical protein VW985_12450 [Gammaproteobacteria bacterium]